MDGRDQGPGPSSVDEDKYPCPSCHLKYKSQSGLARHLKAKHADQSGLFVKSAATHFECDLCACDKFVTRDELMQHHQNYHGFVPRMSTHEFPTVAGKFEVLIAYMRF